MTKKQLLLLATIILIPVIIGSTISMRSSDGSSWSASSMSPSLKKVGLVRVIDVIYNAEGYISQLQELRQDNTIAGVLLRIDSPGGAVAPSQELYEELMRFKSANKPVVVSMGNVAASGGYYIAAPADKIFANPGTITGSIGVIMSFPHYYKLLDKLGIQMTTIKAGALKDIGNPNRSLTDKEKVFLQDLMDEQHTRFIKDICRARSMDEQKLRLIADGRIISGEQAVGYGLVDSLGSFECASSYLKQLLKIPQKTKLVEKKESGDFLDQLISQSVYKLFPFLKNTVQPSGAYFLLEQNR